MVAFAGYSLPVSYAAGIIEEHKHARAHASLFDVSHMGQIRVHGDGAAAALEALMPADVVGLPEGRQRYALLTNEAGGVLDDLMVSRIGGALMLVVNAARKAHDLEHLEAYLPADCTAKLLDDRALLALQGPAAADIIARHSPDAAALGFMEVSRLAFGHIECIVSRSGYTGEDGFEISVPAAEAEALARALLDDARVAPAGLGARDSLRLEAGLCLYGSDLDTTTTPMEAGLAWAVPRSRRPGGARTGGYPGADVVERQLRDGAPRRRVGLVPDSRMIVRAGALLADREGRTVGRVTSGGFGPSVGTPIAMGYVEPGCASTGTELAASVRGQSVPLRVVPLPFVAHRYRSRL
jgi:aminomethyltransferase